MSAGAGEEQHAELLRALVGTGKRRKLPGRCERATVGGGERERIAPPWLQPAGMEMPMLAAGIAHAPAHAEIADTQRRCIEHRYAERRLDEHLFVAHLRQQVAQAAGIPLRVVARRSLCEHFGWQPEAEHSRRRRAQEITSIHAPLP